MDSVLRSLVSCPTVRPNVETKKRRTLGLEGAALLKETTNNNGFVAGM